MLRQIFLALSLMFSVNFVCACSASNYDSVDVEYGTNSFQISKIGVCGPLSAEAATEFMYAGYLVEDLGHDILNSMDDISAKGFLFVAIAGIVQYETPDPSGFSSYAMRVVDVKTGETLWTSEGEYQSRKALRREKRPVSDVFRDMVADFSKVYPPDRTSKTGL